MVLGPLTVQDSSAVDSNESGMDQIETEAGMMRISPKQLYDMAAAGMGRAQIAKAFDIPKTVLMREVTMRPALSAALEDGERVFIEDNLELLSNVARNGGSESAKVRAIDVMLRHHPTAKRMQTDAALESLRAMSNEQLMAMADTQELRTRLSSLEPMNCPQLPTEKGEQGEQNTGEQVVPGSNTPI